MLTLSYISGGVGLVVCFLLTTHFMRVVFVCMCAFERVRCAEPGASRLHPLVLGPGGGTDYVACGAALAHVLRSLAQSCDQVRCSSDIFCLVFIGFFDLNFALALLPLSSMYLLLERALGKVGAA